MNNQQLNLGINKKHTFGKKVVAYSYNKSFEKLIDKNNCVLLTDKNVFKQHESRLKKFKTIIIDAGEEYKNQQIIDFIINEMIKYGADRSSTIVGVGGGVITDIAGYVSAIYMRGIKCILVPTTILSMVDAAIGGKNGIDVGIYKNMIGTIKQPNEIIFDLRFLKTLPQQEWINGFAEIIKHACIKSKPLFLELEKNNLLYYQKNTNQLLQLIYKNAELKTSVVKKDEFEKHERMLLNFGHTLAHAIENSYRLPHGFAVAIGMVYACRISEKLKGFKQSEQVTKLIEAYQLPSNFIFDWKTAYANLLKDKKKIKNHINYVLLSSIGKAEVYPIKKEELKKIMQEFSKS
jgi:3-dehydroquinate synthase